jgi:EAL domain-containing protein (putative c-di-GMP-specific phosphodiesterase class I)
LSDHSTLGAPKEGPVASRVPLAQDSHDIPTYREFLDELKKRLAEAKFLALLLIDVSQINVIEKEHGSRVYEDVMQAVREVVSELKGKQLRVGDIVALNEKAGDVFLVFLMPRTPTELIRPQDVEKIGERIQAFLTRRIAKSAGRYLRESQERPDIKVGSSLLLSNPLIKEERLILRGIEEAKEMAELNQRRSEIQKKQQLQRIILEKDVSVIFQPIMDLRTGKPHGFEALCRGPKGTELWSPSSLFSLAKKTDLRFELDYLCRRKALKATRNLDPQYKLFINMFPFSMGDPSFHGKTLIDLFQETDLAPEQLVLEVTEEDVIHNYALFVEQLQTFRDLRCLIAIDDMGKGYSGLEKIVHLQPNYVKFDMNMVRDIDISRVKQQMLLTFRQMTERIETKLIAEGIETKAEFETVREIGVDYVQGFLLARPTAAFQTSANIAL